MSSAAFNRALQAAGYLTPDTAPAPGLVQDVSQGAPRLRPALADDRIGLLADAVFTARGAVTSLFKDAGKEAHSPELEARWHEAAWNLGLAPLLWVITPTQVRLYDCYSPAVGPEGRPQSAPIGVYDLDSEKRLRELDSACGRLTTETGAFWSGPIGSKIDRRFRVDRQLLAEIKALEEELSELPPAEPRHPDDPEEERQEARDFAQRLIGRTIFTWYLIDRGDLARPILARTGASSVADMLATRDKAFALFDWLRATFNGDLFPMEDRDAERARLTAEHLEPLRLFADSVSLVPGARGQGRLFKFRFDAIPVDLVSSIYQQFARSSAAQSARDQSLHYTPFELIHLTLDPVFEGLDGDARVIDPTCGSGAFLVEAFRRLVWKKTQGLPAGRGVVREVLYTQLYGLDINLAALRIAAFGLYLTALELDEDPVRSPSDLRFKELIGRTLFEADALEDLPEQVSSQTFGAVVGNPPWQYVSRHRKGPKRTQAAGDDQRPRRSPDQSFLLTAGRLAGENGRIGMIMKATPFYSRDRFALEARTAILKSFKPAAIINLSQLRHEGLFPDASGPALLFFARCRLMDAQANLMVGSVPWSASFARNGVFEVGPADIRTIALSRVLKTPAILKAATFGTARDIWLTDRLQRGFPVLGDWLDQVGIKPLEHRGQGFQKIGRPKVPPESFYELNVLSPADYEALRVDVDGLPAFTEKTLHFARSRSIYRAPLLIAPKACNLAALEPGRFSAAISTEDVLYTSSFYGISFRDADLRWAYALSGVLNSSLTVHQFAYAGAAWGLERTTIEAGELLALRVPPLHRLEPALIDNVVAAEKELATAGARDRDARLRALDDAVFDIYDLDPQERTIARDAVTRARPMIFDSRKERARSASPPSSAALVDYASEAAGAINAYLQARGERRVEADVLEFAAGAGPETALAAVRFRILPGAPGTPQVHIGAPSPSADLSGLLNNLIEGAALPYLNERRQLRIYGAADVTFVKPREQRYWSRTAGLNDADQILADHWIAGVDVRSRG
jgi:hypothetical protein